MTESDGSVPNVWLTRVELAERLRLSKDTLAAWAVAKQGPQFAKFGGQVRYRLTDVEAWENDQTGCQTPHLESPRMSNSSQWATSAANKFGAVIRETENPTTKLLAQGLRELAEAVRDLGAELERVEKRVTSTPT
jgi:excisionase family DNA binding protein